MDGASPITSNAAVSSWRNKLGDAVRFLRHQPLISRICHQLQVWFGQGGSPAAAQFVENRGSRSKTTRLRGLPRRRESLVQRATLLVCEVVALVVCDQVDNRSLRQCCRLVEHEPAFLDTGSKRSHRHYCKGFRDGQQGLRLRAEARRFVEATQRPGSNWLVLGTLPSRALFRRHR